jgi:hypothetical protein
MKKQARVFMVLLGIMVVAGLGLTGCPTEDKGESNPFVGTYLGTGNAEGDTMVVGEDSWTSGELGIGTYTYTGTSATLSQGGRVVGSATLSGKNLTIVITTGVAQTYLYTKN